MPRRLRLILGLGLALALTPALPPMPAVNPATWQGVGLIAQQMLIGIGMGLAARIVLDLSRQRSAGLPRPMAKTRETQFACMPLRPKSGKFP